MIDFLRITERTVKNKDVEIVPTFRLYPPSKDLMIRGGDFYAVWDEAKGFWSTSEGDALAIIDRALDEYKEKHYPKGSFMVGNVYCKYMWDSSSKMVDSWHHFVQKQSRDSFEPLDERLIFSNETIKKEDYATKSLPYPLEEGDYSAYDKLMSTLYSPEERHKIEWCIGAIVTGDSKTLQKFMVLYGAAGTGKSTVLNIIQMLFQGYWHVFCSKNLGSASNAFALEDFKTNPLVAIEHDGDLSRIEDNTTLNSLVSHETMTVNEKFKSKYSTAFKSFLIMGTNKPVKITEGKSGLMRRLIDVKPSGKKLNQKEYKKVMHQIPFELGAIAWHCKEVYEDDPEYYDDYTPLAMLGATNDFYNFMLENYHRFETKDGTTAQDAWDLYKIYSEEAKLPFPMNKRVFKEELKNYFWDYEDRTSKPLDDGSRPRSYYSGFRTDIFEEKFGGKKGENNGEDSESTGWLILGDGGDAGKNIFDVACNLCPAQYANDGGTPMARWVDCQTQLKDLDTSRLHYVKVPENHIVIDFDIQDENGNKSLEKNIEAASQWPATYAELSKSGAGIHLHYIYTGDPTDLSRIYSEHVEIKVFTGGSSLRRMLTKCCNIAIATISSGLPFKKKGDKVINAESVRSENGLRHLIERNIRKQIHPGTKPSIDFIFKILDDAYESGLKYDVSDLYQTVLNFAAHSTHQAEYCVKMVSKMKFKSISDQDVVFDQVIEEESQEKPIVFFDVEVFPNLFILCWKYAGEEHKPVKMINPTQDDIKDFVLRYRLIGFNCRKYDNHILYAAMQGYSNEKLYEVSQRIINTGKENRDCFFGQAYNMSYTDVYDFAKKKQSLKKWEIELHIHHQESGLPWDEPVDEKLWNDVADYCENDVIATEAVFNKCNEDFTARLMLALLGKGTANDTTNNLTTHAIVGDEKKPELIWTDLATGKQYVGNLLRRMEVPNQRTDIIQSFPGYEIVFEKGKPHNMYRGTDIGYGGYIVSYPGVYGNVALLDVNSLHPHSAIAMNYFGKFTKRFEALVEARVAIKHGELNKAKDILNEAYPELNGKLDPYLEDQNKANGLAGALKLAINSMYGLTAASFENPLRCPLNTNNIIALRGALFMRTLQDEVTNRGFKIVSIKTDSIKIVDATKEIVDFCMDFAKQYGYTFEHEATYDRICQINDADYIALYKDNDWCTKTYGYIPGDNKKHPGEWTVTGAQFAQPYVLKTLFTHEDVVFDDLCVTNAVTSALYLDMNESGYPDVSMWEKIRNLRQSEAKKTKKEEELLEEYSVFDDAQVDAEIAKGHNYKFVGKVGLFCPVKPGCGGGKLVREKDGKHYAATGSTGYRWLESEEIKTLGKEDIIDMSYFTRLADKAVDAISKYGDFEWFVSDDPYIPKTNLPDFMNIPEDSPDEIPFF